MAPIAIAVDAYVIVPAARIVTIDKPVKVVVHVVMALSGGVTFVFVTRVSITIGVTVSGVVVAPKGSSHSKQHGDQQVDQSVGH